MERWWKSKQAAWAVEKLRLNFAVFSHWFTVHTHELVLDREGFVKAMSEKELESLERQMETNKQHAVHERQSDVQAMVQLSEQINVETDKIRKKATPTLTPIVRTPSTISPAYSTSRTPPLGTSTRPLPSIKEAAVLAALHQSHKSHDEISHAATNEFLQSYLSQHCHGNIDSEGYDSQEHKK